MLCPMDTARVRGALATPRHWFRNEFVNPAKAAPIVADMFVKGSASAFAWPFDISGTLSA